MNETHGLNIPTDSLLSFASVSGKDLLQFTINTNQRYGHNIPMDSLITPGAQTDDQQMQGRTYQQEYDETDQWGYDETDLPGYRYGPSDGATALFPGPESSTSTTAEAPVDHSSMNSQNAFLYDFGRLTTEDTQEGAKPWNKRYETISKYRSTSKVHDHQARGPVIWEYLIELLLDPRYNPSHIRWENEHEGRFRIVRDKKEVIAKNWGSRLGRPNDLSYNNFARTLRNHYKTGMMVCVTEKNHVFQFGPIPMQILREKMGHA